MKNLPLQNAVDNQWRETSPACSLPERALVAFLRLTAAVLFLAALAVVMPFSWMAAAHQSMGLGDLPDRPIVSYLARSASALYVSQGIISLFLSFGVRRYQPLIRFLAWLAVIFGALMVAVDLAVGMPWFWTLGEGPVVSLMGAFVLFLERQVRLNLASRQDA